MGRTKRPAKKSSAVRASTRSKDSSYSVGPLTSRSTSVAPEHVSTPKQVKKLDKIGRLEQFIEEEKDYVSSYQRNFKSEMEEFDMETAMFKLQINATVLNKPLKFFAMYREKYAVGPIVKDEEESNQENIVQNSQESAGKFKKPEMPQAKKRRTTRSSHAAKLRTPKNPIPCTPSTTITPKVNMNRPLSILRHARLGEAAVSMSGSPIMVSGVPREDVATISVPLHDGRVVTMLPTTEFQREQMPSLDNQTKSQLETLYNNLALLFRGSDNDNQGGSDEDEDEEF